MWSAWHLLEAKQAASSAVHTTTHIHPSKTQGACWHCCLQGVALCWKANLQGLAAQNAQRMRHPQRSKAAQAMQQNTDAGTATDCLQHAMQQNGATDCLQPTIQQQTTSSGTARSKITANTTALKVPGRSLSRVPVEPNLV